MVHKHAAAKLALKASKDSCSCRKLCSQLVYAGVTQSGLLYHVVVMSDANLIAAAMDDESGPHARGKQLFTPPVTAGRSRAQRGVTRKLSTVSASDPISKEACSVRSRETNPGLHVRAKLYFNSICLLFVVAP